MNQKQIIGAVVAAGLFIVTGVSSVLTNTLSERMLADTAKKTEDALLGGNTTTLPGEPYIGIAALSMLLTLSFLAHLLPDFSPLEILS